MKNLQELMNYIFEIYFNEIMFYLDLMVILYPVKPEVKIIILLIKYLKKKTD
ncbi:hypothetical protein PT201_08270 [Erysipelothrix rhusiopathiae]|nr:hypothetical protein [Erysipelothrix rhusiopathiae]